MISMGDIIGCVTVFRGEGPLTHNVSIDEAPRETESRDR